MRSFGKIDLFLEGRTATTAISAMEYFSRAATQNYSSLATARRHCTIPRDQIDAFKCGEFGGVKNVEIFDEA
jgi:hypothetical protein